MSKSFSKNKKSSFGVKSKDPKTQIRIISILIFIISFLLLIALVSYTYEDESNIQISFVELFGLFWGDEIIKIKAETTQNWLGLLGAYFSYILYNKTFGFIMISFPIFLGLVSIDLFKNLSISRVTYKKSLVYLTFLLLFSGFMGTIFRLEFIDPFPKEWAGNVGLYISYLTTNLIGKIGSLFFYITSIFLLIWFGTNINLEKYISYLTPEDFSFAEFKNNILMKFNFSKENQKEVKSKNKSIPNNSRNDKIQQFEKPKTKEELKIIKDNEEYLDNLNKEGTINNPNIPSTLAITRHQEDMSQNYGDFTDNDSNEANQDETLLSELNKNEIDPDLEEDQDSPISTAIHDQKIQYKRPMLDLLNEEKEQKKVDENELRLNADILREKLETFKISIENLSVTPGPVVTQYEFVPAAGIKISKIESLSDDLAMALKAKGIRIIAPIPGKGTVGIEIPNSDPTLVTFSSLVKSQKFHENSFNLPLALGKTINGEVYVADLAKMPHLLIAGSTGSGKSVGINTIIASLLYYKMPHELKFVIIDPKKVELTQFVALKKHFIASSPDVKDLIITDPTDAVSILKSLVLEMEARYDILAKVGQKNILDYNQKVAEGKYLKDESMKHRQMPYIVCVIDELADLMLTASKDIEEPIIRLAQMARAVGIHLILATQRPSVDVITGIIKANFPARIGYLVASKIDSRTILDVGGADQLLGNGDLLYLSPGSPKPIRIQNSYISTDEIETICNYIGDQKGYTMPYQLPSIYQKKQNENGFDIEDRDPLFEEAARLIVRHQQGSVSLIQRKLKVGYARAGRIVDELEACGVVGPHDGSKARQVLMESESELEAIL